jgi:hypothetical protein
VTVRRPGVFNEGLSGFYRGTRGTAEARANRPAVTTKET